MTLRFRTRWPLVTMIFALVVALSACSGEGFTASGTRSQGSETADGGTYAVHLDKAQGTTSESLELQDGADATLDATVTLAVGKGSFTLELLGADDAVTLTLQAADGETVEGTGTMVADSFGAAKYRVSARDAENVDYQIVYTYR